MKKNYKRNWLFKLKSLAVFGSMLFAGSAMAQLSGTYTIDAGGGGDFDDFTALQDTLDISGVSGAVIVNVEASSGPYTENIEFNDITGSSSTNTITINGNDNMITSSSANTINVEDANYIYFHKLLIENSNSNGECMVIQGETSNITVDSSEFIKRNGSLFSSGSVYLMISEGTSAFGNGLDEKTDIIISNNYFHNGSTSTTTGGYCGIAIHQDQNEGGDSRIDIYNNIITSWGRYAITVEDVSGLHITHNEIYNPIGQGGGFRQCIYQFNNFNYVGADEGSEISYNYIHDVNPANYTGTTYGIGWFSYYQENEAEIFNNIIDLNTGGSMYGIYAYGAFTNYTSTPGAKNMRHNTIAISGAGGSTFSTVSGLYGFNWGATQATNNNISIEKTNGRTAAGIYYPSGGTVNNNNVYMNNSNFTTEFYANTAFTGQTLAQYLANYPNSVAFSPNFVDRAGGDYTPTSIGMANKGVGVAAITDDYVGASRNATTPDLGAIEYFIDVEVVSVDMTGTLSECAPYEEAVVLTLKNNSAFPVVGIPLMYSINGGTPVTEVTTTSIASGASASFTFANVPTLYGTNTHVFTTGVDGVDDAPLNSEGTYTIGTTVSPTGGDLFMSSQFDGYFNAGSMGDPDVTVKDYVSTYDIAAPTTATNYAYSLTATTTGSVDVTSSGFSLGATTVTADPLVSLAGETIFLEVTVLDNGTGCDTAFGRWMYVPHTPVPSFNASDICLGDIAQFKNTSTLGGTDYIVTEWEFDDPDPLVIDDNSAILNGFWEYSTYGNGVVVEMTVANGVYPKFQYSTTNTINVTPKPEIDFKVLNACEGSPVTIVDNTSTPTGATVVYDWDFGGEFSSSVANPSYTFATPGQRQITLKANANGCSAELTKNAYQFEMPVADFSSVGSCNFVDVEFTSGSTIANGAGMGYSWDFGDGDISREENPSKAFANAGTQTIILTATSEFGCANSVTKSITLNESPEADFTWDAACNLTEINFTRTGSVPNGGANSTYSWDFAGQATSGMENPSHLFSKVGPKPVTLTIADLNGCTNAITKDVNVVLQAVAGFTANGFNAIDVCEGDKAVFTNGSSVAAGDLTYAWNFGDGNTSNDHSPTHTYATPGDYNVTLQALVEGGCPDEVTVQVTVNPSPDATFSLTREGRTIKLDGPSGNDIYRWTFGNGGKDIVEDPTYTYANVDQGTYTVCLATKKGVCSSNDCQDVTINLAGIEELTQNNDMINVYPNPTQGKFNVTVENAGDVVVKVGDILGNVLDVQVTDNLNGTYSVDMTSVADGVYFVQVKNGDFYATKRITVSK